MIGIAGCDHGLGVTHLCIAFANYTASKHGLRTACLEMNDSAAFSQLSRQTKHRSFTIYAVDYFPSVKTDELPDLMNKGYQYYILDFGILNNSVFDEFLRCDKKFLIGSPAPWKMSSYHEIFQKYPEIKTMELFHCLIQFGEKTDIRKISKKLSLSIWQFHLIPFLKNPFHITKEQFSFLEELL